MRVNMPVTEVEYVMDDGQPIVSQTDLKGRITYVNPYFTEVSGYSEEELIGSPHNLVRHPDMPPEAFADLWKTLKQGRMWSAMVKNRRKNGDFYWVLANVTPTARDGQIVGYTSVRTKPTREQIRQADELYRRMREGGASDIRLDHGRVVRNGLASWMMKLRDMSLRRKMAAFFVAQLGLLAALLGEFAFSTGHDASIAYYMTGALGACFLIASWLAIHRVIIQPIAEVTAAVEAIACGDFSSLPRSASNDDIGRLSHGVRQTSVNLAALIGDVRRNIVAIRVAATEIASGNMDLSSRAEIQASSLEESAASMEEFASTVKQNADNAQEANRFVQNAADVAWQGSELFDQVGTTMRGIVDASRKVRDIVSIIDSIAFQTNILALNAAVEAARAGEHGRGFAVVATEVRTLAQRSAASAREIGQLINASVERVEKGGQVVGQAQQTMHEVVNNVKQVTSIVDEIATASAEQSRGVDQVNQAIVQMEDATQHTTALVEQAAAASSNLETQAQQLQAAISLFDIRDAKSASPHNPSSWKRTAVALSQANPQTAFGKR